MHLRARSRRSCRVAVSVEASDDNKSTSFYGKLCTARLECVDTFGFFMAVPGLSSEGAEFGRKIQERDQSFVTVQGPT
jgi:hypothetical protein